MGHRKAPTGKTERFSTLWGPNMKTSTDRKSKKLTHIQEQDLIPKINQIIAEHDKALLKYFTDHLLQVVSQVRAIAIAQGLSPEDFWKAFTDEKAQNDFYVRLHVQEDLHNQAANELQEKNNALAKGFGVGNSEEPPTEPGTPAS